MSVPASFRDAFLDLVTTCAFVPGHDAAAAQLLARELAARLQKGTREHGPNHPALLGATGDHGGGSARASWYLSYAYPRRHAWAGPGGATTPRDPIPGASTAYSIELAAVAVAAAELRATVVVDLGSEGAFTTLRAPVLAWADAYDAMNSTRPDDAGYAAALAAWATAQENLHAALYP